MEAKKTNSQTGLKSTYPSSRKSVWVGKVAFRRKVDSRLEWGVGIGSSSVDLDHIIDADKKRLPGEPYHWKALNNGLLVQDEGIVLQ